jgi:competence protein ComEC
MAGIGLGASVYIPAAIPLLLAGVILVLVLVTGNPRLFFYISIILFFLIGAALITPDLHPQDDPKSIRAYTSGKDLSMRGTVARAPQIETDATRIVLSDLMVKAHAVWRPVGGKLRLTVGERLSNVSYGDTLFFVGTVSKPRNFYNPGGFDYELSLLRAGISVTSFVEKGNRLLIRDVNPSSPIGLIEHVRDAIRDFYDARFPTPEGAVIKALVLGERGDIPEDLLSAYYRTGVGHVLAISGSNVGIVFIFTYLFFYFVLVRCGRFPLRHSVRKWASIVSFFPVIVYTFLAGIEITVVRATLMISVFVLAILIEREQQVFNTLVLAAFVILVLLPASLFDPSFQLSFIAVLSIIVIYPPLIEPLKRRFFPIDGVRPPLFHRVAFRLLQFTLVSCAAIVGILPVSAYYFHRVTPSALPLNFIVVPLLGPVATTLGLLCVPFITIAPQISFFLGLLAAWAISLSNSAVLWTDALLPKGITVFGPTILEMILYYGLILSVFMFLKKRQWALILAILLTLASLADVATTAWHRYSPKRLEATFLSVGNGDSCVIKLPGGAVMVVDGGGLPVGTFDVGENIVAPFLLRERIGRIDCMVLSHPEKDHVGGLTYLMNNFRVGELWITGDAASSEEAAVLIASARSLGVPVMTIGSSTPPRAIGAVDIRFLNPAPRVPDNPGDFNNRSLVFRIDYRRFSLLMTGDIGREGLARIRAERNDLSAQVLKVPHHGSSASTAVPVLRTIGPRVAIISCGYDNPFGFPGKKSLAALREVGADIFRTDLDGAVTVTTDGEYIEVESMGGRRLYRDIPDDKRQ